jgi:hypothetical protein
MGEHSSRLYLRSLRRGTEVNGMNVMAEHMQFNLDWDTRAKLQLTARRAGKSTSALMRDILHDWAEKHGQNT